MGIVDFAVRRPVATTMLVAFLLVMGLYSLGRIPLDLFPRIDVPIVTIVTVYPGASPAEVESLLTDPVEEAVSPIAGIDTIKSTSLEGISQVVVTFEDFVDVDVAAQDIRDKIDLISADLPEQAEQAKIMKLDLNASAVVEVALTGERSIGELTRFCDDHVEDEFTKVPGVANVDVIGGREREIQVLLKEERLQAYGLSLVSLSRLLAQKSLELPGGRIVRGDREWMVRVAARFASVEEIRQLELPTPKGVVRLTELAEIRDGVEEERQRAYFNGRPALLLAIKKRSDANTVSVADGVLAEIESLRKILPKGISVDLVKDRSRFIRQSLDEVQSNLVVGILLTAAILLVFLGSLRATLVAAITMPVSIVATFLLLYGAGISLNTLTLMALAITVGILVNNAIVVLENVMAKVDGGMAPAAAAMKGTGEVALAVAGATLTNVVVFVPIAFMSGIVGKFFKGFGLTATFATLVSLLLSFTLTPMLAARVLRRGEPPKPGTFFHWFRSRYRSLEEEYGRELPHVIDHPFLVAGLCALVFVAAMSLAPRLGSEMMAETDQGEVIISLRQAAGSSLESTVALCRQVETLARKRIPELERIASRVGKVDRVVGASEGVELGQVTLYVGEKTRRKRSVRDMLIALRPELARIPKALVALEIPGIVGSSGPPLQVEVLGSDMGKVASFAEKIRKLARGVRGCTDVDSTWLAGRPELTFEPDRVRCERAGVQMAYVAQSVRGRYAGLTPVTYREGAKEFDVRVMLAEAQRRDLRKVGDLQIVLPDGRAMPLRDLGTVVPSTGAASITRLDRRKAVVVSGFNKERSYGAVLADLRGQVEKLPRPDGVTLRYSGTAKRMRENTEALGTAFVLASLLTYMLLATLMESFMHPLLILVSLPLSFVGIVPALFVCNMSISLFSQMAVVMLVGIVVNNGILIIENVTALREGGMALREAVLRGTPERLRPILMTSLAAALAMIPMALGQGEGGEMRAPMAVVSIGGIVASMFLSILVIPMLYYQWERLVERWQTRGMGTAKPAGAALVVLLLGLGLGGPSSLEALDFGEALALDSSPAGAVSSGVFSGPRIPLGECLATALRDNRRLEAASIDVSATRSAVTMADGRRWGRIEATASRVRYNEAMMGFTGERYGTAKGLSWKLPLDVTGALASGRRQARLTMSAAEVHEEMERQKLALDLVMAYHGLLRAQWLERLAREYLRQMDLQLQVVEARVRAGAAMASERLRVEVAQEEARTDLIRYENERQSATAAVNLAMGRAIDGSLVALEPEGPRVFREALETGYHRAECEHPALKLAELGLDGKGESLRQARAARRPSLAFSMVYGDENPIFAGEHASSQYLLAASLPLFEGGGLKARVRGAERAHRAEAERLAHARRAIRLGVKKAHLDVETARHRIDSTRRALASARENARVTENRYRQGAAIVLELVDSQTVLLGARVAVLGALVDFELAVARYGHASGRIWDYFRAGSEGDGGGQDQEGMRWRGLRLR